MSNIHAAIVTYRNPSGLDEVIHGLDMQDEPITIHVKDNSDDNIYYTAGINVGIKRALAAGADYILICADDVIIRDPFLVTKLVRYMSQAHSCAMACPLHLSKDEKTVTFAGGEKCFPYGHHMCPPLDHEMLKSPYDIPWANTTCVLLRAEAVIECGLLDEKMRFVCSDSDYSFTLRARGWTVDIVPEARVIHEANMALKVAFDSLNRVKHEDFYYFIKKWITGGLFQELAVEGRDLTVEIIGSRINEILSTLQHHDILDSRQPGSSHSHAPGIQLT